MPQSFYFLNMATVGSITSPSFAIQNKEIRVDLKRIVPTKICCFGEEFTLCGLLVIHHVYVPIVVKLDL